MVRTRSAPRAPRARAWRLAVALVLAFAPALYLSAVGHAAVILTDVVVRVYDNTGLPSTARRAALGRAADIFAGTEVEIGWVHCPARCGRAPSREQLILRITKSPRTAVGMGASLIDPVLEAGRLATVYVDQVDAMARQSGNDRITVMGRAIAHELGHLLLGTGEHTRTGLMRGTWTLAELRRNQPEDWQFTPVQRTILRARIATGSPNRWNAGSPRTSPGRTGS